MCKVAKLDKISHDISISCSCPICTAGGQKIARTGVSHNVPEREVPELGRVPQSLRDRSRSAVSKPVKSARVRARMPTECMKTASVKKYRVFTAQNREYHCEKSGQ